MILTLASLQRSLTADLQEIGEIPPSDHSRHTARDTSFTPTRDATSYSPSSFAPSFYTKYQVTNTCNLIATIVV